MQHNDFDQIVGASSVPGLSCSSALHGPFPYVHESSAVWCPVPVMFKVPQNFWMRSKRGNTELGLLCASLPSQPWQCCSDGLQKAELGWCRVEVISGGEGKRNLVDWSVVIFLFFSRHTGCCWILVSQHKVGARRGELFILWGQPLYLQPHQATCKPDTMRLMLLQVPGRTAPNVSRTGTSEAGVGDALNSRHYQRGFLLFYVFGSSLGLCLIETSAIRSTTDCWSQLLHSRMFHRREAQSTLLNLCTNLLMRRWLII